MPTTSTLALFLGVVLGCFLVLEAGAIEVHLRISLPPYRSPCFYGMDTGDRSTLLAADRSVDEIATFLGVDSLAYLELDRLLEATGAPGGGFCTACLSGSYPTDLPMTTDKYQLEHPVGEPLP